MPQLVVIIGPIASGKSTVADALGKRLRAAGRSVAVIDLDEVVGSIGGFVNLTADHFMRAQAVCGQLVGSWLRADFDVIVHGPFFQHDERAALLSALPDGVVPRTALLHSTFEAAVTRVEADPERKLSKDLALLKHTYERVASLLPDMPPPDWFFDTTTTGWPHIVAEIGDDLLAP